MKYPSSHLLDLDKLTGTEYVAGWEELFTSDFFINYWETTFEKQYSQLEFAKDYGNCLCTCYGALISAGMILKRELTPEERLEMVKLRVAQPDFEPTVWGFTSVWVDVVRKWYNKTYPSDPIASVLVNDITLIRKLYQKSIPLVTSMRGNKQFSLDQKDWVMNELNYWNFTWPRYGHCRTRKGLKIIDNYLNTYRYRTGDELELVMNHAFESNNTFLFFKESSLSAFGKTLLKAMRRGLTNGERMDDYLTRFESSRIGCKWDSVDDKTIWNGMNWTKNASKYEFSLMANKWSWWLIPVYLGVDKNQEIKRRDAIEYISTYL